MKSFPTFMIEPLVRDALKEDLGRAGDITSHLLVPKESVWKASIRARQEGVLAGFDAACLAFKLMDPDILIETHKKDGDRVARGEPMAFISGHARAMLAAERTALNFMSHLSGIATLTSRYVLAVKPFNTHICCTRKTTPLLRAMEKRAVLAGGGHNHRFGLDDAVLIKDNHVAIAGSLKDAVERVRANAGHMVKIALEIDTISQLYESLDLPIDVVMLDNMTIDLLCESVALIAGRFVTEASGGVTLENVREIASSGVNCISVGALTHSAPILDFGLDHGI